METPNFNYIKQLSGGDLSFENQLLNVIQNEFPKEKETYYTSVVKGETKAIAEIVHKLKHKISILGLEKSYETAILYEESLNEGEFKYQKEFEDILTIMTSFLASL